MTSNDDSGPGTCRPATPGLPRRAFLRRMAARGISGLAFAAALPLRGAARRQPPRILLRPGTAQHGNIGDIAHSPGALVLFERHFPEAEFSLWPVAISPEARESLQQRFPRLRIVEGTLDRGGRPTTPELRAAWDDADLLLHGSSPGFKGDAYMPAWRAASRKPYGVFGMTDDPVSSVTTAPDGGTLRQLRATIAQLPAGHLRAATHATLSGATFLFCRETLTAEYLRAQGVRCPVIEFGPDATFALQLRDDARAAAYLQSVGLEPGRFLCVIPRLRYTPYYKLQGKPPTAADLAKDAVNDRTVEADHAKLRDLIARFVRATGLKVLACPEMKYQVELARTHLVEPLPDDVKRRVVWRDSYWLPTEAASVYASALAVVSCECHSPIIALTNGTPAIYVRQPTDTIKGQMYHDIGVGDWTGEIDELDGGTLWERVRAIHADPAAARARVQTVMAQVAGVQRRMVEVARAAVGGG
jgi:hypothetical protein